MIDCREVIGVPFVAKGHSLEGFDCLGLCVYMLNKIGVKTPNFHDATWYDAYDESFVDFVKNGLQAKKVEQIQEGCLIEFKCQGSCHVGFCIDDSRFVHASTSQKQVVIENINRWKSKIQGVYCVNN